MPNSLARHWLLEKGLTFLNHGSFGACPKPVLEVQARLRAQMERDPVRFFTRDAQPLLDEARETLARFLGCLARDLVFVPNATTAVNSVLRSIPMSPGDELVVTDHEYNACRNVLDYVAKDRDCVVRVATLPYPLRTPGQITEAVLDSVTAKTRLVLLDHVTSVTGLVLPMEDIAAQLAERNVQLLVDGAHAPGMLPLDLDRLNAAFYTGNCHKWLCAPKGAGFLWVREDRQIDVRPAVISHGANAPVHAVSRFRTEFDWTGTRDLTAYLALPAALAFLEELDEGGWAGLMARNRDLARAGREILLGASTPPCPPEMLGSLVAIPISGGTGSGPKRNGGQTVLGRDEIQDRLYDEHRIQAVVGPGPGPTGRLLRASAQVYNDRRDFERLADALDSLGVLR